MKGAYKIIAGNSRITPFAVALALFNGWILRSEPWAPDVVLGILLAGLVLASFERVT